MINQATSNRPDFQEKDAYKCYIGQCLQQPLIKGDDYTFTFYTGFGKTNPRSDSKSAQPFRVGIYGHTDCSAIPFGKINVGSGCPLNYEGWVQLGVAIVKGNENWVPVSVKLTITKNINALLIGPDCTIVSPGADDFNSAQNYLDKLQLSETINFNFKKILIQNGNACIGTYTLKAPFIDGATYQWYKDSIAISGATGSLYHVAQFNGSGFYNVRISRGNNCETTDALHIPFSKLVSLYIPADTFICKNEILEIASSVNGILYEWNGGNSDSVIKVVQPGSYNIVAYDTNGCRRPFVVNVRYQDCDKCTIYMPNAFTPNNDGLNDILRGSANCSIDDYSFQIYNRWGQKVFESNTIINGWDGTHNNKPLPGGAYIYVVRFKNSSFEAKYKLLKGYVNLIR
ncbi:MAG: gliding motility-associated C-terminal domain-containing protein [Chitinophagaceae bacterium]|nr:gliding motility-associated C-terminal domain-containing protein [Chitinophagaceae bacterium]